MSGRTYTGSRQLSRLRSCTGRIWSACLACLAIALATPQALAFDTAPRALPVQGTVEVAFAPWDDVESIIIQVVEDAHSQVLVQAYLMTSKKIAQALITAHERGIDVRVLADQTQSRIASAKLGMLEAAGVPVWLETKYENAHNKVIIVDASTPDATIVTGSFNFTWNAQHRNAENILVLRRNPEVAARYALNWERHRLDAAVYHPAR